MGAVLGRYEAKSNAWLMDRGRLIETLGSLTCDRGHLEAFRD